MILFRHVLKRYANGFDALKRINFHVDKGELAYLTGHSGAGKSTLLKLIRLIEKPTRGQVVVNDLDLAKTKNRHVALHRRAVGMVYQDHRLLKDRTVFDNVALPLVVAGVSHRDIGRRVRAALDKVGLLDKENLYPVTLSGGEQQRVGIARAVVNRPPLLLADEPTGNLDAQMSDEIMSLFKQFNQLGVTILIATHDQQHLRSAKARIFELKQGLMVRGADSVRTQ